MDATAIQIFRWDIDDPMGWVAIARIARVDSADGCKLRFGATPREAFDKLMNELEAQHG